MSFVYQDSDPDRPLDPRWVDVDFSEEAKRGRFSLGCEVRRDRPGDSCPIFETVFAERVIPRSDWKPAYDELSPAFARHKRFQYDQNGDPSCTGNATAGCVAYSWTKQFGGNVWISPSCVSTWKFCARGPNSGSSTGCNLKRARDVGMLLQNTSHNKEIMQKMGLDPGHTIKANGYRQSFPNGWEETAKNFQIDEYYEIKSVDGFFTALLLGFDVLYGRSGHAIHGVDIVHRNGGWHCKYDNSWGRWGDQGFGYDSLSYVKRKGGAYGAYAVQHVRTPDAITKLLGIPELEE